MHIKTRTQEGQAPPTARPRHTVRLIGHVLVMSQWPKGTIQQRSELQDPERTGGLNFPVIGVNIFFG